MQFNPKPLTGLLKAVIFLVLLFPSVSFSQTTYLPQDARENILLERLEIKMQTDSVLNFSKTKPFSRKQVVTQIERFYFGPRVDNIPLDTQQILPKLQPVRHLDTRLLFDLHRLLINSSEWTTQKFQSKKTFLK